MKVKVDDLRGVDLDMAVHCAYRGELCDSPPRYSREWEKAGPVIRRHIAVLQAGSDGWLATCGESSAFDVSPLVAAMRAYIKATFGDEMEYRDE